MNYEEALKKRWKARTDLIWLCNNVLGMHKVSVELNGEMVKRMYHFPKPKSFEEMKEHDRWDPQDGWIYEPLIVDPLRSPGKLPDAATMPGKRNTLLLDSRSFYKSSINVIGHSVQWILNYPDITMLLFQGTLDLAEKFLVDTRNHFQLNERMRELFPELCVPSTQKDFGTKQEFTVPGRTPGYLREQPTMKATSIMKAGAGQHVEVIKFSDIVNEDNANNKEMCAKVTDRFYASHNLRVGARCWIDVEGTRYHSSDCYGEIIEEEMEKQRLNKVWMVQNVPYLRKHEADQVSREKRTAVHEVHNYYIPQPEKRDYNVYINICYKLKDAATRTYDYDDMLDNLEKAWARDAEGNPVSRNPVDWPTEKLEAERKRSAFLFACQKLNNPSAGYSTDTKFPVDHQYPRLIQRRVYRQNIRIAYYDVAVDTANTISRRADYSCIIPGGFDGGGRCYIPEIVHGKFHEEEIADKIMDVCRRYHPRRVLMEKDRGAAGVRVWLNRMMQLSGDFFNIEDMPIMSQMSKVEKIGKTLRPWYISGALVFLDDIGMALEHLRKECERFPRTWYDDILDTLSALFYGKEWVGRNFDRPDPMAGESLHVQRRMMAEEEFERHIGINDWLGDDSRSSNHEFLTEYQKITGGL